MSNKIETFTDLSPTQAAQVVLLLARTDVDDVVSSGAITFIPEPGSNVDYKALITVQIDVKHADLLLVAASYPLLGNARKAARGPAGVRAVYREQWEKHPIGIGASIPIHPDSVDLWAAEIEQAGR